MNHEVQNFAVEVITRSETTPVLVDFWAPWCGPCKMLSPVLEKLAAEPEARWVLATVNTDENQDLAAQFAIRSIPSLKLFHHGNVMAELAGALPEAQLRAWLAESLPTPKRETMGRARELLRAGRAADAARLLEPLLAAEPGDIELAVLTARALVFDHPSAARALVSRVEAGSPWSDDANMVAALAAPLLRADTSAGAGETNDLNRKYVAAIHALRAQDFRAAAAGFVAVLTDKPDYDEGRAHAACRALFRHLGIRHPVSEEFSRAYGMAVNV